MTSSTSTAIPEISDEQMKALIDRFMTQGATFKELKGFSSEEMEAIYSVAYNLFQYGKHEDAEKVFRFLCFFDHLEKKFWLGLGATRKALGNHSGAIDAFGLAGILDVRDPRAPMQAAESHIALGNKVEAISGLTAAIEFAGDQDQYRAIKERAQAMLKVLEEPAAAGA